jgi:drug/metabolite transporter (DMT)-like permease
LKTSSLKSNLYLITAALIWGFAFVAQSVGLAHVGPFTFNAIRCVIGSLVLLPIIFINNKKIKKNGSAQKGSVKLLVLSGVLCGLILCVASALQQYGLMHTTVGKSGFITALYIVLVPILGIFFKKRAGLLVWASVAIAVVGMYFLCISENTAVNIGDIYTLLCAVAFAFHIIAIDYFAPKVDGVTLSCIQFFVCAVASAAMMPIFGEYPKMENILAAWIPLLYAGALSCGIAYTFQILGQRNTNPTVASLILSFESVFALLGGILLLKETPQLRELFGSLLMFCAVVLSQIKIPLPFRRGNKPKAAAAKE